MDYTKLRHKMVDDQIIRRGITDPRLTDVLRTIPRHECVPAAQQPRAYEDIPLPIGQGQTISQPYMVALMTDCLQLKAENRILEIGTGSGYQTAVLAALCAEVVTIERIAELSDRARATLTRLGFKNIRFSVGNGAEGFPEVAEGFDGIIVTAASSGPLPQLLTQLKAGGRMVVPIGAAGSQILKLYTLNDGGVTEEDVCQCVFVPLIVAKQGDHDQ